MPVEIALGILHFRLIYKAGVTETAVGKGVNNRPTEPHGQKIVDQGADNGAECGEEHNKEYIHVTAGNGYVGSRRHHHLRGEWQKGAFYHHEQKHKHIAGVMVEIIEKKLSGEPVADLAGDQEVCHWKLILSLEIIGIGFCPGN